MSAASADSFTTALQHLYQMLHASRPWTILTGAGISTDSGIPDYRDASGAWKRPPPVTYQAFMGSMATRQRYWARSLIGWPVFAQAQPNATHHAIAQLQQLGVVETVITQNVDGLHQQAGSPHVIDLHGRLDQVVCTQCSTLHARSAFQTALLQSNPHWAHRRAEVAPDGDADLEGVDFSNFQVPSCPHCGGILKPDVVFYGENVPRPRVQQAMESVRSSGGLLVIGSSLMVYSGLRFVHAAQEQQVPVAAINLGATRADSAYTLKLAMPCAPALHALLQYFKATSTASG